MRKNEHNTAYAIYTLQAGDTLESIAALLGEDKSTLVMFHNIYAKDVEIIGLQLPKQLTFLYVQPNINTKALANEPAVQFSYDAKIDYMPNHKPLHYLVTTKWYFKEPPFDLTYTMQVTFIEKVHNDFVFEIIKSPFEPFDNEDMLQLDVKIVETLYPLRLYVNENGLYKGVANIEDIQQRWQQVKADFLETYEQSDIQTTVDFYDQCFKNASYLEEKLKGDVFISAYFCGLHTNYTTAYHITGDIYFPVIPNIPNAKFTTDQYIDPYLDDEGFVCIKRLGVLNDERAKLDFETRTQEVYYGIFEDSNEKAEGSLTAEYTLDAQQHCINTATVETSMMLEQTERVTCHIMLLEQHENE
jgi:hypothetical protein